MSMLRRWHAIASTAMTMDPALQSSPAMCCSSTAGSMTSMRARRRQAAGKRRSRSCGRFMASTWRLRCTRHGPVSQCPFARCAFATSDRSRLSRSQRFARASSTASWRARGAADVRTRRAATRRTASTRAHAAHMRSPRSAELIAVDCGYKLETSVPALAEVPVATGAIWVCVKKPFGKGGPSGGLRSGTEI